MIEIQIKEYEGPMDLLIRMIDENKINIYDIPINEITEAYLNHIENLEVDSDNMAEFIVMASSLLEIKSKLLLPSIIDEDDAEDPREELVNRIVEYKLVKLRSELLKDFKNEALKFHSRLRDESAVVEQININLPEDITDLTKVFQRLIERLKREVNEEAFESEILDRDEYSLEEYMNSVIAELESNDRCSLRSLVKTHTSKKEVVVVFVAILELIRRNLIRAIQYTEYDLMLYRVNEDD